MQLSVLLLSTMTAMTLAGPVPEAAANEKRQDHKTIFVTAGTNWSGLRAWVPVGYNVMYNWAQVIFEDGSSGSVHGPGSLGPDPGVCCILYLNNGGQSNTICSPGIADTGHRFDTKRFKCWW